jgi:hypothetical protein
MRSICPSLTQPGASLPATLASRTLFASWSSFCAEQGGVDADPTLQTPLAGISTLDGPPPSPLARPRSSHRSMQPAFSAEWDESSAAQVDTIIPWSRALIAQWFAEHRMTSSWEPPSYPADCRLHRACRTVLYSTSVDTGMHSLHCVPAVTETNKQGGRRRVHTGNAMPRCRKPHGPGSNRPSPSSQN